MTLLEFHADLKQLTFQMKRIADLLKEYVHPPAHNTQVDPRHAKLTKINPKNKWEAELEDMKWRRISAIEASVMPRK